MGDYDSDVNNPNNDLYWEEGPGATYDDDDDDDMPNNYWSQEVQAPWEPVMWCEEDAERIEKWLMEQSEPSWSWDSELYDKWHELHGLVEPPLDVSLSSPFPPVDWCPPYESRNIPWVREWIRKNGALPTQG